MLENYFISCYSFALDWLIIKSCIKSPKNYVYGPHGVPNLIGCAEHDEQFFWYSKLCPQINLTQIISQERFLGNVYFFNNDK